MQAEWNVGFGMQVQNSAFCPRADVQHNLIKNYNKGMFDKFYSNYYILLIY